MPQPKTAQNSECAAHGTMGQMPTRYVREVWGAQWDAIPTAVDRSRLIAAAPDLLGAARHLLEFSLFAFQFIPGTSREAYNIDELRAEAQNAILKATGG